jgi:hypothetical protein
MRKANFAPFLTRLAPHCCTNLDEIRGHRGYSFGFGVLARPIRLDSSVQARRPLAASARAAAIELQCEGSLSIVQTALKAAATPGSSLDPCH